MTDTLTVFVFLGAIAAVGCLAFIMVAFGRRSSGNLDVAVYQKRWMAIEQTLSRDVETSHQLVVLQADKLLDHALRAKGLPGKTMGERMKSAQSMWSNANAVWSAHKLRNQIAHDNNVKVQYNDARRALGSFKQGLKDLGAI